jgi:transposase
MRAKPLEREQARALRVKGVPMKQIAARLNVSPASVHLWTKDIRLTPEQVERIREGARPAYEARAAAWRERNRLKRLAYQAEGRARARLREPLHQAGCMLYWAEGTKNRNTAQLVNSDVHLVRFFVRFLRQTFGLSPDDFTLSLNVYLDNGFDIEAIEKHWLTELDLPPSCLRKHQLNHMPTSSSGRKRGKLPHGVCTIRAKRSTWVVQHIYGAIQEYAGFDEPAWLDCAPTPLGEQTLPA